MSENRTQLIDCRRLLHIVLLSTGTRLAHFPQSPDHRPSIAAILFVLCEASSEGAGHNFAAGNAQAVIGHDGTAGPRRDHSSRTLA